MIRKTDLEFINGKMEQFMKENLRMIWNMDKGWSSIKVEKKLNMSGKMDKSKINLIINQMKENKICKKIYKTMKLIKIKLIYISNQAKKINNKIKWILNREILWKK